ncbi:MAG: GTP cyclohydrolase I FolE [Chitinophagales bacterium]|nr:GTP cyclohydrolase I FolE [Chitinophagales bacterium]MDW8273539.1 GTP cyclohydrolase I FolE [Chitinophagales bacterium]
MNYQKHESFDPNSIERAKELYEELLSCVGEDTSREGLQKTPLRASKALHFLTQGYYMNAHEILASAIFHESHSEIILIKDIEIFSLCEHHLLPFFGKAHIAYIPDGRIAGLSKFARVVDVYARRLQVQERLTIQIRDCINDVLKPQGVAVVIEAQHLCMMMRGVQKQNSVTTTSAYIGAFENMATRNEFLKLLQSTLR